MYVCMYVCMHACMHACMDVCLSVCLYVCMYVCMYVCNGWTVSSGSEMEVVYCAIRHVLADLQEQGLQLSLGETAIILELRGAGAAICMRKYLVERTDKPGRYMKFVIQGEAVYVKLQDHHVYLGAQIGFQKFEQDTNKYRLGLAKGAFSRLAPILKCRTISLKIRLHLWQGTVLPTMLHGLDCMGLTIAEAGKMISVYYQHARAIAKSFSMITRETNTDFARRLGLANPIERLLKAIARRQWMDPLTLHFNPTRPATARMA